MISVVLVTYNSADLLASCLGPLVAASGDIEVVIVDNASSDESIKAALAVAPDAVVVRNSTNVGFAAAVNAGIEAAAGDQIFLLNPDAIISQKTLQELGQIMDNDNLIGAIAPLVTASGDGGRVIAAGAAPTILHMFTHMTGLSSLPPRVLRGHYEFLERVKDRENHLLLDWVSGGCVLVRRDALEAIGGLSERWFMYAEDIDMCLRLNDAGWRVVLVPALQATHETGQSSAGIDGRVSVVWLKNLFDLYATRYRAGRIRQLTWATVVYLGFRARQAHASYKVGRGSTTHDYEARRFGVYATGIRTVFRDYGATDDSREKDVEFSMADDA